MAKYKICPFCKMKNNPILLECINCETDLTGEKITDEESEKMREATEAIQAPVKANWVRVCACGARNQPNARKCSACKEDISDILPAPEASGEQKSKTFVLSSLDGRFSYQIADRVITVGRENIMREYLSAKSYVSRAHAILWIENNRLMIKNLSNTNFTYVNNKKITAKVKLEDGDEIGLGGMKINGKYQREAAYFLVRISPCM